MDVLLALYVIIESSNNGFLAKNKFGVNGHDQIVDENAVTISTAIDESID